MAVIGKAPSEVSDINVTPLVDVMLVLLIIFMVITPMLQKGVSVDMAKAVNAVDMANANKTNAVVIAITRDGKIYLGSKVINADEVTSKVKDQIENKLDKTVYLRSDARAQCGGRYPGGRRRGSGSAHRKGRAPAGGSTFRNSITHLTQSGSFPD